MVPSGLAIDLGPLMGVSRVMRNKSNVLDRLCSLDKRWYVCQSIQLSTAAVQQPGIWENSLDELVQDCSLATFDFCAGEDVFDEDGSQSRGSWDEVSVNFDPYASRCHGYLPLGGRTHFGSLVVVLPTRFQCSVHHPPLDRRLLNHQLFFEVCIPRRSTAG